MATVASFGLTLTEWVLVKKGRHLSLPVDVSKDEVRVILSQRKLEVAEKALTRPSLVSFSSRLSY